MKCVFSKRNACIVKDTNGKMIVKLIVDHNSELLKYQNDKVRVYRGDYAFESFETRTNSSKIEIGINYDVYCLCCTLYEMLTNESVNRILLNKKNEFVDNRGKNLFENKLNSISTYFQPIVKLLNRTILLESNQRTSINGINKEEFAEFDKFLKAAADTEV